MAKIKPTGVNLKRAQLGEIRSYFGTMADDTLTAYTALPESIKQEALQTVQNPQSYANDTLRLARASFVMGLLNTIASEYLVSKK